MALAASCSVLGKTSAACGSLPCSLLARSRAVIAESCSAVEGDESFDRAVLAHLNNRGVVERAESFADARRTTMARTKHHILGIEDHAHTFGRAPGERLK